MKKLIAIGMVVLICLFSLSSCSGLLGNGSDDQDRKATEGVLYVPSKDGSYAEVVDYVGSEKDVVIAKEYDGLPVKSIASGAFYNKDVTTVYIPDSVTHIGSGAFRGCAITSVTIGKGVASIGLDAFWDCYMLTSITVDEDNANYKSIDGNLYSKDGKTFIRYAIGKVDTSFNIPDSVTNISDFAFDSSESLTNVTIPESVTSIGLCAFSCCWGLECITVDEDNAYYMSENGNLYSKDGKNLIQYAIGNPDTSFAIPENVTSIGEYAFYYCEILTSVTIPESVTNIGAHAFDLCTELTSIVIPDSVTKIDEYTFFGCNNLTSVTIGKGVTSIDADAFAHCKNIETVYYTGTEAQWSKISIDPNNWEILVANIIYDYIPE